jgi:hypothetical protein
MTWELFVEGLGSFHEVFKSYIWELGRHFRELRSYEVTNSS